MSDSTCSSTPIVSRRRFIGHSVLIGGLSAAPTVVAADPLSKNFSADQDLTVIELFTSQGCSSCPPADRILADLVTKHEQEGYPVLGLSFHVDYWNYLGWSDPFSSPRWSTRQKQYASVLKENRIYTPQMIFGGRKGIVGSRRKQVDYLLGQQQEVASTHHIKMETESRPNREISISFDVEGDEVEGHVVNIAIVARSLTATATRGENAGKTLTHANVVRRFATRKLTERQGEVVFEMPDDESTSHSVIAYVQSIKQATITTATELVVA